LAIDSETATWQLACLRAVRNIGGARRSECLPCLGNDVSVDDPCSIGPSFSIAGNTHLAHLGQHLSSDQHALPTKWQQRLCCAAVRAGAIRAAIGSTLLRSPGSTKPVQ